MRRDPFLPGLLSRRARLLYYQRFGCAPKSEVRFAWSWVGYPSRRPTGCGMQEEEEEEEFITSGNCSRPLDPKSTMVSVGVSQLLLC